MENRGAPERPCSECGLSVRERVERGWPRRRVLMVQVGLIAVALIWLGWRAYENWPSVRTLPGTSAGIQTDAQFPASRFTAEDLERIVEGELEGVDLLGGLLFREIAVGWEHVEIAASFGPPSGSISSEMRQIGWPAAWLTYRYDSSAEDVYTRARSTPAPSARDGQTLWSGRTLIRYGVEGGRRKVTMVTPEAIGGVVLVALLGWYVGRVGRWIVRRCRGRGVPGGWARGLPLMGVVCGLVTVAVLSPRPIEDAWMSPRPLVRNSVPTGIRAADVDRSAASQQRLARAILDAVGDEREGVLIIGTIPRADMSQSAAWTFEAWPGVMGYRVAYSEPPRREHFQVLWDPSGVAVIRGRAAEGGTVVHNVGIRTHAILNLALVGVLLWQLPVFAGFVSQRMAARLGRKRLGRGLCVNCGYPAPGA